MRNVVNHLLQHILFISGIAAGFYNGPLKAQKLYPAPDSVSASKSYQVTVNGRRCFVYDSPIPASFCSFEMDQPVDITIKADRDIKWVDVRPFSAKINAVFRDSCIQIHLSRPQQISVELNGMTKNPLFIFANEPERNLPGLHDPNIVYFAPGKRYDVGLIHLKSNQSLYIAGGAVVVGAIEAEKADHLHIFGRGILDGTFNENLTQQPAATHRNNVHLKGAEHNTIQLKDCNDVTLEGITIYNSTSWDIVPIHCNGVKIDNVKIVSDNPGDDGIDIVRDRNLSVTNSFIRTKDDCIAIKGNFNYPPSENVENISVKNCTLWNAAWGNALEIGFELQCSAIRRILFENIDIIHVEDGAAISIHNADQAVVSEVTYNDIRIEDATQKLFDFAIFRSQYSIDGVRDQVLRKKYYLNGAWDGVQAIPADERKAHARYRGRITDIALNNIQVVDGKFPFSIFCGYDAEHRVSGIKITYLMVHGKKISSIKEARIYQEQSGDITIR